MWLGFCARWLPLWLPDNNPSDLDHSPNPCRPLLLPTSKQSLQVAESCCDRRLGTSEGATRSSGSRADAGMQAPSCAVVTEEHAGAGSPLT
jgi:hypothetical protein